MNFTQLNFSLRGTPQVLSYPDVCLDAFDTIFHGEYLPRSSDGV
jgi:hypothetical protein